ncbi:DUF748 domain-containing protein [Wenyingzhuangia sp. IMCC45533]
MKKSKSRKSIIIGLSIVVVILIGIRIALPYIVKDYLNKTLKNDIPGHTGSVKDIEIDLYRGAYVINDLNLKIVKADSEIPFLDFKQTDISVQWKALFKGSIVSEIEMYQPKINYVLEDQKTPKKDSTEVNDWTEALTKIVPLDINRLKIDQGTFSFMQLSANPDIDLKLTDLSGEVTNLRNVYSKEGELPSTMNFTAKAIGGGNLAIDGKLDLVKQIPDLDLSLSLEDVDMTALNDLTRHYAKIDFEKGSLNVFSEVAIAKGYLKGYVKPLLKDTQLINSEDSFLDVLWESVVSFFKFAIKNQKKDTVATKIPLEGDLNSVGPDIWKTVGNIFKNAWIQAFKNQVDDSVEFDELLTTNKSKID